MTENSDQADQLIEKLEILQKKQDLFAREINQLKKEIYWLRSNEAKKEFSERYIVTEKVVEEVKTTPEPPLKEQNKPIDKPDYVPWQPSSSQVDNSDTAGSNIEKFIGENLINKIGIAITIIGVAIGVKYSIDHDLISPLTRILLGYFAGLTLLFFGIRLKAKYENYSAVLVSGSMAVMYFLTYAAFSFYALFPQTVAFAFMVIITVFTVFAALKYDQQIIALIGQAGAYAVPFLLSEDPGNAGILFSYMAIINIGILVVSVKKYWEPLYFVSFALTWLIYFSWYSQKYQPAGDFNLAFLFLGIFFVIFYLTFLAYKVIKKQQFDLLDILLLLANSTIFYGIGYSMLVNQNELEGRLGLFTLANALMHFAVCLVIYYRKIANDNLFNFILGMALVFVTIAIPVQLEGNWVTLLWAGEMVLLFWIGRTKKSRVYEILSYPMVVLTFLSLVHSWSEGYFHVGMGQMVTALVPIFNIYFLTSMLVVLSFGFLTWLNRNANYTSAIANREEFLKVVSFLLPSVLLFTLYFSFRNEIACYWDHLHYDAVMKATGRWNRNYTDFYCSGLLHLKPIWLINYSLFFFSTLAFLNIRYLKNRTLGLVNLVLNLVVTAVSLTIGLYILNLLGTNLTNSAALSDQHSFFNIWIRYILFVFLALTLFVSYRYIRQDFLITDYRMGFDLVLFTSIICVASSELINWMNIAGSAESYKLGISILWGVYSLLLISLGIWKKKKYLRIGAIALFGVTLIKLFLYDLSSLDTISKTIVFVSLGVLLLIISFIYNKYKNIITD